MLWNVDPSAAASLPDQIAASVRRAVAQGELSAGDRLPPAAELAEALDVEHRSVAEALAGLDPRAGEENACRQALSAGALQLVESFVASHT